jgi:hypothetical protein
VARVVIYIATTTEGHMATVPRRRQHVLLAIVIASIVILVADIIAVNIDSGLSWTLAVPVGMLLVPIVGIVSFVMWFSERRRTA